MAVLVSQFVPQKSCHIRRDFLNFTQRQLSNLSMTDNKQFCPACGLALAPGDAGQGCPHCLLRLALTADEETDLLERKAKETPPLPSGLRTRFFADYEVLEEIARGGMGVIYKARQLSLNRLVALKMIQASHLFSSEARLRFRMEVEAVAQLNHPHIVPLYESGEHEGTHFFTMRLVEGGSLAEWIAGEKGGKGEKEKSGGASLSPAPFPPFSLSRAAHGQIRQMAALLAKIARAVHYAHQRGILHRDLKPSNILLDAQGEPHVADFGLAKMLARESGFTFTESILGSPNYMAPEQASGQSAQVTVAADVYGLGAILYELLTGQPPFKAATPIETIRKVCDDEPLPPRKLNPAADADLETICLKCLRKEPATRYSSAEELAADLDRWLDGRPILARPVGRLEQAWRWCQRQPALASALAASVILLLALVIGTAIAGVRIHRAELQVRTHRQQALLGEVRALRLGSELGERGEGLRRIRQAAALGGTPEFRQRARVELLALLARTDVLFASQPSLRGSPDPWLNLPDPSFTRLATVVERTNIVLRAADDGRELRQFAVDGGPVLRLETFSPDGRFLALSHSDGWSVWDVQSGERCFSTNDTNHAYCFAPDRPLLILQDAPSELSLLELPSGRPSGRLSVDTGGHPDRPHRWSRLALSPDGRTLAAARARSSIVELVDLESGQVRRRLTNSAPCTLMAWSGDGVWLATAITNGRVPVWRAKTGRLHMSIPPKSSAPAHSLAFNADATLLAAAYADRFVRLMDVTAMRFVFVFPCDSHQITFEAGGARLGPVLRGPEFGWLDIQRPTEFHEFNAGSTAVELTGCQFSPDGRLLVCGTLTNVLFCDAATGAPLQQLRGFRLPAFAFDPRGEALFASGTPGLYRWTMRWPDPTRLELLESGMPFPGAGWRAFNFSAHGDWFAAANVRSNAAYVFDRSLTNWIAEAGPHPGADAVAISPDGRWLATGSSTNRQVKVWAASSGRELLTLAVGPAPQVVFSADGKWLAAFGDSFHLYATDSWQPAPSLPFPDGAPVLDTAAFSPNGRVLAVICDLSTIRLFDLLTWQPIGLLRPAAPGKMTGLAFSPDGTRLAAVGNVARVRVWDLRGVRGRLAELGLDWDLPPLELATTTNTPVQRVTFPR